VSFDPTIFRQDFAEFGDFGQYSDARLNRLASLALRQMDACRWGEWLDDGTNLFVAHKLCLGDRNRRLAESGGNVGVVQGPLTAKAVGEASAAYDASMIQYENGGEMNMTTYGLEWLRLSRMVGAGPIQVS
jgi:uncharacterized protein DUF4054